MIVFLLMFFLMSLFMLFFVVIVHLILEIDVVTDLVVKEREAHKVVGSINRQRDFCVEATLRR